MRKSLLWMVLLPLLSEVGISNAVAEPLEIIKVVVPAKRPWSDYGDPTRPTLSDNLGSMIFASGADGDGAQEDPPSNANTGTKDCENLTDKPVVITTGEKYKQETDFVASGQYNLGLRRTYRSAQTTGLLFGGHWLSSWDGPKLIITNPNCLVATSCVPTKVTFVDTNGDQYAYTPTTNDGNSYNYSVRGAASTGELTYNFGVNFVLVQNRKTYVSMTAKFLVI
jgi:hypothetical protein